MNEEPRLVVSSGAVLAEVGSEILRGDPHPGARAPSEAELTASLRVSRTSARRALATLGAAGMLDGRSLATTRVSDIGRLLRLLLPPRLDDAELLSIRTALERSAAAASAGADLADLTAFVVRMKAPGVTREEFRDLDTAFHLGVARASNNALHEPLLTGLQDAIAARMGQAFARIDDWPATAARLAAEHEHLLALIRDGRAAEAADFAEAHVHNFYK